MSFNSSGNISEISHQRVEKAEDALKAGSEIQAVVINVDPRRHKIGLSIKDVERYQTQQARKETAPAYEDDTSAFRPDAEGRTGEESPGGQ